MPDKRCAHCGKRIHKHVLCVRCRRSNNHADLESAIASQMRPFVTMPWRTISDEQITNLYESDTNSDSKRT